MRLFAAIELTDAAREAIAREQQRVLAALRRPAAVRPVNPAHMHLTLLFLGEVPEGRAAAIVEASNAPLAAPPFAIAFGGIGVFPPRGAPRVLWLGVVEGEAAAIALQRLVEARLVPFGVAPERRAYHPHLTLARWKESRPTDRPAAQTSTAATIARVDVQAVTLFHSRLSPKGPTYTALARAPLQ